MPKSDFYKIHRFYGDERASLRITMFVGGAVYTIWGLFYNWLDLKLEDPTGERIGISIFCILLGLLTFKLDSFKIMRRLYLVAITAVMLHHFSLLGRNSFDLHLVISLFVGPAIIAAPMTQKSHLFGFYLATLLATFATLPATWPQTSHARIIAVAVLLIMAVTSHYYLWIRQNLQRDLKLERDELSVILDHSPFGVALLTPDLKFMRSNLAFRNLLGYSEEELITKSTFDITYDQDLTTTGYKLIAFNRDGGVTPFEKRMIKRDGSLIELRVTPAKLPVQEGFAGGVITIFEDITKQKELQADLDRERAMLAEAARISFLSDMAGGVAHEINNPLAIIKGKINVLQRDWAVGGKIDERSDEALKTIDKTVDRIAGIVRSLRYFAQQETETGFREANFRLLLDDAINVCMTHVRENQIDLKVFMPDDIFISCIPQQIVQALVNIVKNATEAASIGPEKWISIQALPLGKFIELRVADSGPEIPEATRERIFVPFFTTKQVGKGTGLGLSVAKGIIDSHQGLIFLDEAAGVTCFVIRLPIAGTREA